MKSFWEKLKNYILVKDESPPEIISVSQAMEYLRSPLVSRNDLKQFYAQIWKDFEETIKSSEYEDYKNLGSEIEFKLRDIQFDIKLDHLGLPLYNKEDIKELHLIARLGYFIVSDFIYNKLVDVDGSYVPDKYFELVELLRLRILIMLHSEEYFSKNPLLYPKDYEADCAKSRKEHYDGNTLYQEGKPKSFIAGKYKKMLFSDANHIIGIFNSSPFLNLAGAISVAENIFNKYSNIFTLTLDKTIEDGKLEHAALYNLLNEKILKYHSFDFDDFEEERP